VQATKCRGDVKEARRFFLIPLQVTLALSAQLFFPVSSGRTILGRKGASTSPENYSRWTFRTRLSGSQIQKLRTASPKFPSLLAAEALRRQMAIAPQSPFLFPSDRNKRGHQPRSRRFGPKHSDGQIPYFRIYDLRPTYATRLSD
jgi:hypothetical protein